MFPPQTSFFHGSYCLFYRYPISTFHWLPVLFSCFIRALATSERHWLWSLCWGGGQSLTVPSQHFWPLSLLVLLPTFFTEGLCYLWHRCGNLFHLFPSLGIPVSMWHLSVNYKESCPFFLESPLFIADFNSHALGTHGQSTTCTTKHGYSKFPSSDSCEYWRALSHLGMSPSNGKDHKVWCQNTSRFWSLPKPRLAFFLGSCSGRSLRLCFFILSFTYIPHLLRLHWHTNGRKVFVTAMGTMSINV